MKRITILIQLAFSLNVSGAQATEEVVRMTKGPWTEGRQIWEHRIAYGGGPPQTFFVYTKPEIDSMLVDATAKATAPLQKDIERLSSQVDILKKNIKDLSDQNDALTKRLDGTRK